VLAEDGAKRRLPSGGAGLEPLVPTKYGTLYRNPASPCFTG
jgi:hypothetical protein